MNYLALLIIILLEGFVTISIEILAIRQLIPAVGNSVVVTSLIIGVFLLFLAYGYRRGGEYTAGYREKLKTNFTIAAILIGFGLSYTFISLFFSTVQYFFKSHTLLSLTLYLLVIIAPIVYLLGQTVPITVNLFKQENEKTIGAISGKVLHLSTLGSFLGAVLTTLLFMNYLGVAWTIVVNVGALFLLIILLVDNIKRELWKIIFLGIIFILAADFNLATEKYNFIKTTPYGNYRVNQEKDGKLLMINDSSSSFISETKQGFPYIYLKRLIFRFLAVIASAAKQSIKGIKKSLIFFKMGSCYEA